MNGLIPADPIKMNEQKLTKTKKILPQEWIQDYFNPVVGVLSTPDVNALCHKNNLSMGPVFSIKLNWLTWIWLRIWVLSQDETIIAFVWPLCQTEQNHKIIQFVLCRITIFCHQLTQNTMTDFVRFTKIYTNCSEIQNLIKSDKSIVIFWVNCWQLFPLKRQLFSLKTSLSQYSFLYSLA